MSLIMPSLAATCQVLAHFCRGAESKGVIRVRPAEYIYIKAQQVKIWSCEGRALLWSSMRGKSGPYPRATQFSLPQILLGGGRAQQGGTVKGLEEGARGSMRGRYPSGFREGRWCCPHPRATQFSPSLLF